MIALGVLGGQDHPYPGEKSRRVGISPSGISKAVSRAGK